MSQALTPRLVARDVAAAIEWYGAVFGARQVERYTLPDGAIAHAAIEVYGSRVAFAEAAPKWHNHDPVALGGSPVILSLEVDDPDAVFARALAHGARVIFPLADQPYGQRDGRFVDPFGHVWLIWKDVERLSPDEIQQRMAAYDPATDC